MKYAATIFAIVFLAACAQRIVGPVGPAGEDGSNGISPIADASILSSWVNGPSSIPALDFSQIVLNTQVSAETVVNCPANPPGGDASGNAANGGAVLQVTKGNIEISGSSTSGIVQFGPQPHDHSQTGICYIVGQEAYSYEVTGNTLTLCDSTYKVCSTFTKAQ